MKRIAVVVNDLSRAQEHEWFVEFIDRTKINIEFVLINSDNSVMSRFLENQGISVKHFKYRSKLDLPGLIWGLFLYFRKGKFDIVHTHLFDSSISGLSAAFLAGIPMRIMTRHYSDYHHKYFPATVKYDRFMNRMATHIIAISRNVENILISYENVKIEKVILIHHGLNMNEYKLNSVSQSRIDAIRNKYDLVSAGPVIGAISRFTELKGLQYLIPAFKKVLLSNEHAVLVMANAAGDYESEINQLLSDIPEKNIRKIKFENDIAALYKVFDCFVHIPIAATVEAFGQTYIESLASRVPSVFTLSGVAPEFIEDKINAFVVDYCDSAQVYEAINYILTHRNELTKVLDKGYEDIEEKFNIDIKMRKLEQLYLNNI